ncbi:hypothetical protein [Acinetobacter modestus]|uniref:Uncharacterized protein n=1 Tax=Acinetobacter modestus TaxID=1776740 RepID=A0ABP2TXM4_9GAMM|nr:hypothetical protein [Acinetobacter modestus]ENU27050.1 hypothetical protein F992_01655 [Acinetobacter modestus]GGA17971.1 hypothetical protein GCM10017554_13470 [Acinetobacter modestus]
MAVQSYSQEIWDRLKLVYESSPKITWQKLVDQVGEELGCEMPSPSVVRRKAIAEKWKKCAKNLVKKNAKQINDEIKNLTSKMTSQKEAQDYENKEENGSQKSVKNPSKVSVYDDEFARNAQRSKVADTNKLTATRIIRENRLRSVKLASLIDSSLDSLVSVRKDFQELDLKTATEDDIGMIKFKMAVTSQFIEQNLKQSISIANVAKIDAMFWGLTEEDLKDQSEIQAKRSAVVAGAEERMRLAKEKMATDKKAAFARKLAMIEAGDPEPDQDEEQEAIA